MFECFVQHCVSQDKTLKCPVFRIRGPVPANSFILLPKNSSQSLGLTGRFFYLLFRPTPGKYFVVHLDVAAGVSSLIWLHDPLCISFIFAQRNQDCVPSFSVLCFIGGSGCPYLLFQHVQRVQVHSYMASVSFPVWSCKGFSL